MCTSSIGTCVYTVFALCRPWLVVCLQVVTGSAHSRRSRRVVGMQAGFTLVEVLVVVELFLIYSKCKKLRQNHQPHQNHVRRLKAKKL